MWLIDEREAHQRVEGDTREEVQEEKGPRNQFGSQRRQERRHGKPKTIGHAFGELINEGGKKTLNKTLDGRINLSRNDYSLKGSR